MGSPQRPDLAEMAAAAPLRAGPSAVDMQAAAQAGDEPHIVYAGRRYGFTRRLDMFDLGELGEAIDMADEQPMSAIGRLNRFFRDTLVDWPALVAAFRAEHTDGVTEEAMTAYGQIASDVFVALTARPTQAPEGSSDGRTSTSTSSKGEPPNGTPPSAPAAWTQPPSTRG